MSESTEKELEYFEKLIISNKHVKDLKLEIGMLESERDELNYEVSQLKKQIKSLCKMSSEDKIEIKRGAYYDNIRAEMKILKTKLGKYKRDNDKLIQQVIKLQNEKD